MSPKRGLAGAACAYRLAGSGASVLVLEREHRFTDRVRGDALYPWGVVEAERLGVLDGPLAAVSRPLKYWHTHVAGLPPMGPRDLASEGEGGPTAVTFFHPELQTAVLLAAEHAGAEVVRGAAATGLYPAPGTKQLHTVEERTGGVTSDHLTRFVIGADGRTSRTRVWGGFEVNADPEALMFAGVLLAGAKVGSTSAPRDTAHVFFAPSDGFLAMVVPIDGRRTRAYGGYHLATGRLRLNGMAAFKEFRGLSEAAGVPSSWFEDAEVAGPLAEFSGADVWVESPYRKGVALVGDAAAASDPSFGCGTALALRGARTLTDELLRVGSFEPDALGEAGRAYAAVATRDYGSLHRLTSWLRDVYRVPGTAADAMRAGLWPLYARDPSRVPDVVLLGPDAPSDEAAKGRFLGLDRR